MTPLVDVENLVVEFSRVRAVDGVSLTVVPGGATALVGRNGAGKSTTLRVLAGVLPPTAGLVRIAGFDIASATMEAKSRLGYCPDVGGLVPRATAWEHLQLAATMRGMPSGWEVRATDLLDRFELSDAADRVVSGFSHGMARRMSVILAAIHRPEVLLLDEPFDGVDPTGVDATMDVIREARLAGSAVVVSTHLISLAAQACDEALVLRSGRVAAETTGAELAGEIGDMRYRSLLA